jgi:tRNA A37 threonylcarbamoyladenosine modification protein TsaB
MGLATAWRARLMGAPSICAIESAAPDYAVAGDARRDGFFFAEIQDRTLVGEPLLLAEDELRARIVALGALPIFSTEQLPQFKDVSQKFPTAAALARLAASGNRRLSPAPLQPLYLREPSITFPKTTPMEHR